MAHRLATPEGKRLYARRKCRRLSARRKRCSAITAISARPMHTPEPVFGIIKSVLGFRQFLLRGLDKVRGEWSLVTISWNMKRIFALTARKECVISP